MNGGIGNFSKTKSLSFWSVRPYSYKEHPKLWENQVLSKVMAIANIFVALSTLSSIGYFPGILFYLIPVEKATSS